ncbi:MAG: CDP-diacylglycerol--serine O-phosphatidyltransferase [Spirochaetota bacterium]|jgi:CDP-diacylglycerol--serine O-phosphatidyltransferase
MNLAWIPNSLTMGNLLCGFISVIFASTGTPQSFMIAGLLILGAALLDGLDGPIARALKVDSSIGAELDSLADCVTFGVAPGYLAYQAYLSGMIVPVFGKSVDMGIFLASIFPICAAYRLARFNVNHVTNSFSGLPSPVAGIIIALVPVCFHGDEIPRFVFAIFFVIVALLMVSTFKYQKPQASLFKTYHGVKLLLFLVIIVLLIVFLKQWAVFVVISIYILSGILSFVIQFIQDHKY